MQITRRSLNRIESNKLSQYINQFEKANNLKLNWKVIFILLILICLFATHIYYYDKSNWSLISKFLISICPIIIWIMVENKFKGKKEKAKTLNRLKDIKAKNSIEIIDINANRVIEFIEKEDEGILYLIETSNGQGFYLWDEQYLIPENRGFPCTKFEIYLDNDLKYAIDEKICCKGNKIESIKISGENKWKYFKKGFPQDLEIERRNLDEIIYNIKTLEK
ncbi:hypothetical protein D3C87_889650 [compost metagenome]